MLKTGQFPVYALTLIYPQCFSRKRQRCLRAGWRQTWRPMEPPGTRYPSFIDHILLQIYTFWVYNTCFSACRFGPAAARRHRQLPQHRLQSDRRRKLPVSEERDDQRNPHRLKVSKIQLQKWECNQIPLSSLQRHSKHS